MSKKQTTGLIVAAVIFVVVGIISVITNALSSKMTESSESMDMDSVMESFYGTSYQALAQMPTTEDFVAVVPIEGTIQASTEESSLYGTTATYNHDMLMEYVNLLIENDCNKGIVLRLNTPGGTVYEADELYMKLMEYKEKTGRPIWAYMESQCCSGGVYLAAAADEQYANRITTTGSIGVILSTYDMSELYEKLGIKEVNIVSSENKDMGSVGKPMSAEQKAIYQSFVDEYYERFIEIVATGRNMSVAEVKKLADGRIYTASQAVDNGLIDGIKSSEEFDAYVKEQCGEDTFFEPSSEANPWAQLFGMVTESKEKSEAEVLVDLMNQVGSGVPMYYAEPFGR